MSKTRTWKDAMKGAAEAYEQYQRDLKKTHRIRRRGRVMTNRKALRLLKKLTDGPLRLPQKEAAERVSKATGVAFLYLYWLPRNYHTRDPKAHARSSVGRASV